MQVPSVAYNLNTAVPLPRMSAFCLLHVQCSQNQHAEKQQLKPLRLLKLEHLLTTKKVSHCT